MTGTNQRHGNPPAVAASATEEQQEGEATGTAGAGDSSGVTPGQGMSPPGW